jgi:hypothetical protein
MIQLVLSWIAAHPYMSTSAALILLETLLRLRKTERNESIIDAVHRLLNIILPNLKKEQDETGKPDKWKIK